MKISIRMKRYSIIMMSILFMLISCAEEGPYKMGQLEFSIKCDIIAPTSAIVSVKIPQNNENILNDINFVYIADRPLNNYETITESDIIKPSEEIGYNSATEEYAYIFNGLWPNTTYYVLINSDIQYDHDHDWSYPIYYYPGFSFTTKKEGEDTVFGDFKLELVNNNDNNCTVIKIITPYYCFLDGNLYASTSLDFKNTVKSDFDDSSFQLNSFQSNIYISKISPILEKEKYYFKFEGDLLITINYDYFINHGYLYDNDFMLFENVSIQIPGIIDLSSFN